jgi:hypothetical protein
VVGPTDRARLQQHEAEAAMRACSELAAQVAGDGGTRTLRSLVEGKWLAGEGEVFGGWRGGGRWVEHDGGVRRVKSGVGRGT